MPVTMKQCKAFEGRIVDLRVGQRARLVDQPAFRCRLVEVTHKDGQDMIYVEPITRPTIGLALPLRHVKSIELSTGAPETVATSAVG